MNMPYAPGHSAEGTAGCRPWVPETSPLRAGLDDGLADGLVIDPVGHSLYHIWQQHRGAMDELAELVHLPLTTPRLSYASLQLVSMAVY